MLISFLDGSKTHDRKWVGLGGLVISANSILELEYKFVEKLRSKGVPKNELSIDTEVKWSPKKQNWIRKNLNSSKRTELYRELLSIPQELGAKYVCALFHVHIISKWKSKEKIYHEAYTS